MHILLLTNYWPPEIGAASHLYYDLSQALAARGHQVTVLTGFPRYNVRAHEIPAEYRGKLALWEDQHGVRVRRVQTVPLPQHVPVLRGIEHFLLATIYALAGSTLPAPDALLLYSPPLPIALAAGSLGWLKRCPFVINVQDVFPQSAIDLGLLRQPLLIRFFEWLERRVYQRAEHVTVHSSGNRAHIAAKLGSAAKISMIHNWIDADALQPGPRDNDFRRELGLGDAFVVSFAGTMGYSQDLDTVLHAAAHLRARSDVVFVLVGDGVETPRLKALAERLALPNVRWVPMQPRERYPAVLHASDASLITLRREVDTHVVPSKLLSIMAAGRAALGSLTVAGDAGELIRSARCGLCAPPETPNALAAAVAELAGDRAQAAQMGHNGRAYLEQHFTAEAAAVTYERLFAQLARPA